MTLFELGGVAPRALQVSADRGDLAACFMHLEHAGLHQVQVVEEVEILVEQLLTREIYPVERRVPATDERSNPLIGGVVNREMDGHSLQVLVAQVERDQARVIVVQMNRVEAPLLDVTGHRLTDGREELKPDLWVGWIDGLGIRPVELPGIPEVDHSLAVREDVLV